MINSDNYILWFIDYADNKLNEEEKNILRKFLLNFPELQNEFLDFLEASKLVIEADAQAFLKDIQSLKKEEISEIETENTSRDIRTLFEYTEGNLSFDETIILEQEIRKQPELAKTVSLLEQSKISSEHVEYPHKNELKKRVVPFILWKSTVRYGSMAASLALIFWLGANWNKNNGETYVIQQSPSKGDIQKILAYMDNTSNERALAIAKEWQAQQTVETQPIQTKYIYIPQNEASQIASNTKNVADKESLYIPTPVLSSTAPNMNEISQPTNYLANTISNPQLDPGKFTPIKPESNMGPFELQIANSDKKQTKFVDVLSTIVTLGGVLDKKDTRMVTGKTNEKGSKKVHFYSKAFEAEFAVKE